MLVWSIPWQSCPSCSRSRSSIPESIAWSRIAPVQRRRWLDWAVFHVEPNFVQHWQAYSRALRQRNAALRCGANASLWDGELVRLGQLLSFARARLIDALQPYWIGALKDLGAVPVSLGYFQGWSRDQDLAAVADGPCDSGPGAGQYHLRPASFRRPAATRGATGT